MIVILFSIVFFVTGFLLGFWVGKTNSTKQAETQQIYSNPKDSIAVDLSSFELPQRVFPAYSYGTYAYTNDGYVIPLQ